MRFFLLNPNLKKKKSLLLQQLAKRVLMRDMKSSLADVKRLENFKEDSHEISNGIPVMISFVKKRQLMLPSSHIPSFFSARVRS